MFYRNSKKTIILLFYGISDLDVFIRAEDRHTKKSCHNMAGCHVALRMQIVKTSPKITIRYI